MRRQAPRNGRYMTHRETIRTRVIRPYGTPSSTVPNPVARYLGRARFKSGRDLPSGALGGPDRMCTGAVFTVAPVACSLNATEQPREWPSWARYTLT